MKLPPSFGGGDPHCHLLYSNWGCAETVCELAKSLCGGWGGGHVSPVPWGRGCICQEAFPFPLSLAAPHWGLPVWETDV